MVVVVVLVVTVVVMTAPATCRMGQTLERCGSEVSSKHARTSPVHGDAVVGVAVVENLPRWSV